MERSRGVGLVAAISFSVLTVAFLNSVTSKQFRFQNDSIRVLAVTVTPVHIAEQVFKPKPAANTIETAGSTLRVFKAREKYLNGPRTKTNANQQNKPTASTGPSSGKENAGTPIDSGLIGTNDLPEVEIKRSTSILAATLMNKQRNQLDELNDSRTKTERLAAGIKSAALPDCLGPKTGGVESILFMVIDKSIGKCR